MIGSFLNRGLLLIFGYALPAFECYKSVEMNKPDIEQLRFWCQYWILVAVLAVCEKIGDMIIGWLPMYGEAKLAFVIYLWYPNTKGTSYIYNSFFRPYIAKHETEIDHHLLELRTRAFDMAFMYWQKSAGHVQTTVLTILRYIVTQSPLKQPAQPQHGEATGNPTSPATLTPGSATQPQNQDKPTASPTSSTDHRQGDAKEEAGPHKPIPTPETSKTLNSTQVDSAQSSANEETAPFTRTRLRKVSAAPSDGR